jgi:hypothetical protein
LVLTNSTDETATFLGRKLAISSVPFVRLDTDTLTETVKLTTHRSRTQIELKRARYFPDTFSSVWLRRPEHLVVGTMPDAAEMAHVRREWFAALEGFLGMIPRDRWINHPINNASASHKLEQLSRARQLGMLVPETIVTQSQMRLLRFFKDNGGQIIIKPMSGGYLQRDKPELDTVIYTNAVSLSDIRNFPKVAACPALFQERIDKARDVRITIIDQDVHAVSLQANESDGTQRLDIRRNRMEDVKYEVIDLPNALRSTLLRYVQSYDLRFAAIDMAITSSGRWIFFEINPNGQWAWLDLTGVTNISGSFVSCFTRCSNS